MIERVYWDQPDAIERIYRLLMVDSLVIAASDTVFGFLAPLTKTGFEELNIVKKRNEKPYLILISDIDKLKHFVEQDSLSFVISIGEKVWPGPVTIVCKAREDLPSFLRSPEGTVAIRIPDHPHLQKLLDLVPGLFSTSANQAGAQVPTFEAEIDKQVLSVTPILVLDRNKPTVESMPSTILDCTQKPLKILRHGAFSKDKLQDSIGTEIID